MPTPHASFSSPRNVRFHVKCAPAQRAARFLQYNWLTALRGALARHRLATFLDSHDAHILASAPAVKANLFVTGDKALLGIRKIEGMAVVSPLEA